MDNVVRNSKQFHVAVENERFTPAKLAIVDLVPINDDVVERVGRAPSINCDAVRTTMCATVFDIVDVVIADFNVVAVAANPEASRESGCASARFQVADFKADDFDIRLVLDDDQARLTTNGQTSAVDDRRVTSIVLQDDVSASCGTRVTEGGSLVVYARQYINSTSRTNVVQSILNMSPRQRYGARVGVTT